MRRKQLTGSLGLAGLMASLGLVACGGGSDGNVLTPPALEDAPAGAWLGFYRESPDVGDPDPAVGTVYLSTDAGSGNFRGRLSFQYRDCQKTNAVEVFGQKQTRYLAGLATGTLDSLSLSNPDVLFGSSVTPTTFEGSYSTNGNTYSGTYNRSGLSNSLRTVGCGQTPYTYTLASKGAWTVYPLTYKTPATLSVVQSGDSVQWSGAPAATTALIAVLNPALMTVNSPDNGFIRQQIVSLGSSATAGSVDVRHGAQGQLVVPNGQAQLVSVQFFDKNNQLVGFETLTLRPTA